MPSDMNPVDLATAGLAPALDEFRSAVANAGEEVRAYRAHHQEALSDPVGLLGRELGLFADGLIDTGRLAGLMAVEEAPDPLTDKLMAQAHELFSAIMEEGKAAFQVTVPAGEDLRDAVKDALADLGRAFGTAHAVEKARDHTYQPDQDYGLLHRYPFHKWSRLEKEVAPPLVVEVEGSDLRASGLVEFMDGWQKLALVVKGKVAPAPLARLVSPGVFVAQTDATGAAALLAELAPIEGPGIVAIFEDDAGFLPFAHRPGHALDVDRDVLAKAVLDASKKKGQPGILDLRHLESLTALPGPVASGGATGEKTADQLAAWLLSRTDLDD